MSHRAGRAGLIPRTALPASALSPMPGSGPSPRNEASTVAPARFHTLLPIRMVLVGIHPPGKKPRGTLWIVRINLLIFKEGFENRRLQFLVLLKSLREVSRRLVIRMILDPLRIVPGGWKLGVVFPTIACGQISQLFQMLSGELRSHGWFRCHCCSPNSTWM